MIFFTDWYVIGAAFILDLIIGDPLNLPHPVRWMGKAIEKSEPFFRKKIKDTETAGICFSVSLILSTIVMTAIFLKTILFFGSLFGNIAEIILLYYCISTLSLKKAAMDVVRSLKEEGLSLAKKRLALIVGRDVDKLDEEGVSRAAFETVAENLVDGVISPLFWAAIGGVPLAMAYKMVNTLDSMVGYKNEAYRRFGKASAKIDDAANYIPARLSVLTITLASYLLYWDWQQTFKTAVAEGRNHASPNAGFSEAAFAGALKVRLGGPNYYGDRLVSKPYIGEKFGPVSPEHVKKSCELLIYSSWITVVLVSVFVYFRSLI